MARCASIGSFACFSLSFETQPSGDISVMPHAWQSSMPRSSKARIIAGGTAAPPTIIRLSVAGRCPLSFTYWSIPAQTVGTPAEKVTRSVSKSSHNDLPSSAAPGMTIFAPTMGAVNGNPHAFAWNIGTTGRTQSRDESDMASGRQLA